MTLNANSKYPSRRTYVVKVRGDAMPDGIAGRLENVVTGQQQEFATAQELIERISCDLELSNEPRLLEAKDQ